MKSLTSTKSYAYGAYLQDPNSKLWKANIMLGKEEIKYELKAGQLDFLL